MSGKLVSEKAGEEGMAKERKSLEDFGALEPATYADFQEAQRLGQEP